MIIVLTSKSIARTSNHRLIQLVVNRLVYFQHVHRHVLERKKSGVVGNLVYYNVQRARGLMNFGCITQSYYSYYSKNFYVLYRYCHSNRRKRSDRFLFFSLAFHVPPPTPPLLLVDHVRSSSSSSCRQCQDNSGQRGRHTL